MRLRPFSFHRIARKAGGLALGVRLHFPISIWDGKCADNLDGTDTTFQSVVIGFDLVFWHWAFSIDYDIKPL